MSISIEVNGRVRAVDAEGETPLLYALRNDLKLKGARFGCGLGVCGACTVVIEGKAVQSCDISLAAVAGKRITTIEGIGSADRLHALQAAFLEEQAAQCGYCTSGIIMTAYALLAANAHPTEAEICAALDGNICRCGTHARILRAIKKAAAALP
ncbi:MAG TPA: (2Fe-2S)-binding protein [Burkholderiales bacterium]|jgi:nicotinate dehydrogenase subunit A|nr:(2Fe-2S)-binding protein [Burkholderiales bacterium]